MFKEDLRSLQQFVQSQISSSQLGVDEIMKIPAIPNGFDYVEPTLFHCAHNVFTTEFGTTIYLGPRTAACTANESLKKAGIIGIVNCTPNIPCYHKDNAVQYCNVPINDEVGADIFPFFDGVFVFLQAMLRKGSVLVHCEQGISRSATIVIAYLMRAQNMSLRDAYILCKTKRPIVRPNPGFWNQLLKYESHLHEQKSKQKAQNDNHIAITLIFDSDWIIQSNTLFCTCQQIPNVLMEDPTWEKIKNLRYCKEDQISRFFFSCLDFIWGRGVLDVDIDWLTFICKYTQENCQIHSSVIVHQLFDNPDSVFSQSWCGEIYPRDVKRVKNALSSFDLTCE